jgi:hypothetical protein
MFGSGAIEMLVRGMTGDLIAFFRMDDQIDETSLKLLSNADQHAS